MSKSESRGESVIDSVAAEVHRSFTVGIDADGFDHHYRRSADAIVVYDGRELDGYHHLNGRTIEEWWRHVARERGWESQGQLAHLGIDEDLRRKGGDE